MKRFGKWILGLTLALCMILSAAGCTNYRAIKPTEQDLQVVAQVGGFDVYYDELRYLVMNGKTQMEADLGRPIWNDPSLASQYAGELAAFVEDRLLEYYALPALAMEYGYTLEALWEKFEKQVDAELETLLDEELGGPRKMKKYKQALSDAHMTDRYLRFAVLMDLVQDEVFSAAVSSGRIENDSATVKNFILGGGFVRTLHVYLQNDEGDDPAQNYAQIAAVREELAALSGQKAVFDAVCRAIGRVSEDTYMTTSDGYYFGRGKMTEAYEDAAFGLDLYGVSDVVESGAGYYVIVRLPLEKDYVEKRLGLLVDDYQAAAFQRFLRETRAGLTLAWTELGAGLDLTAMQ